MTLFNSPSQKRSLKYLKLSFLKMEREFKKVTREYEKTRKDYFIEFMIDSIKRIENKKVSRERTTKKKIRTSRSRE